MKERSTPPVRVGTRQLAGAAPPEAVVAASRVNQSGDQRKQALRLSVRDCSKPQGIILDPFGGSGTTLIAQRRGYLMELDPRYVDVTIRCWQELFGAEPRHAETGKTFAEMQQERAVSQMREVHHG